MKYALAIDQGTSGTKAIIFGEDGSIAAQATEPLASIYYNEGFAEQIPGDIVSSTLKAAATAVKDFLASGKKTEWIVVAGISNQRESFVLWDGRGKPLTNVILWQCKRSIGICEKLKAGGKEETFVIKAGLPLDPYFSGTKVTWLFENDGALKSRCDNDEVYFGTVDAWLLYNLTDGREFKTDVTNASRTLFFNLETLDWDVELLKILGANNLKLPNICRSAHRFGTSTFGGIFPEGLPIGAMIGDSHAASFGEGCFTPGTVKATMGTGSSVMLNTGGKRVYSKNGMVSTVCWSMNDRIDYALEGVIVSCGSTVNWFQNQLKMVSSGREFDELAESVPDSGGVVFLPAFSGLGGPHWQMDRKAEITGITFGTTNAHIARAALEAYPFQLKDVIDAMESDMGSKISWIKADGGLTKSRLTLQLIADLLNSNVIVDERKEASAFGAALLAFIQEMVLTIDVADALITNSNRSVTQTGHNTDPIVRSHSNWLQFVNDK